MTARGAAQSVGDSFQPVVVAHPDALETMARSLVVAARAAADRVAVGVRTLTPSASEPTNDELQASVRSLHAVLGHLQALYGDEEVPSRPARAELDAVELAHQVAEELEAEGVHVRVEPLSADVRFPGDAAEIRRILQWLIERALTAEGAPWVAVRVSAREGSVIFELPWVEDVDQSPTAIAEREWLMRAVHSQTGTLITRGLRARLVFSQEGAAPTGNRDPGDVTKEIHALREQRAAQVRDAEVATARLHVAETELNILRRQMQKTEQSVRSAVLDLQRALEPLGGMAAALSERDPLGSEIHAITRSALGRMVELLRDLSLTLEPAVAVSGIGPRIHSDDPEAFPPGEESDPVVARALSESPTLPPPAEGEAADDEPREADIPLNR